MRELGVVCHACHVSVLFALVIIPTCLFLFSIIYSESLIKDTPRRENLHIKNKLLYARK